MAMIVTGRSLENRGLQGRQLSLYLNLKRRGQWMQWRLQPWISGGTKGVSETTPFWPRPFGHALLATPFPTV